MFCRLDHPSKSTCFVDTTLLCNLTFPFHAENPHPEQQSYYFYGTKNLAKELNIPLVRVDCTSHFSAKAVARLGFDCVYTLPYSEHLDSDGYPVFTPELPHTCVKTYVHLVDLDGSQ
ncbi:hypothetical protein J6590_000277 [Homalodisca vitripennis]|nr:hypothetical protein J6590_000277 [Homalodisca vitripennis]